MRKLQFLDVGGFDPLRFARPSIEDIELGRRLRASGHRIVLNSSVQGTHLKIWTFFDLIHTEVVCRAIPWSRLLLQEAGLLDVLNVSVGERMRAVLAIFLVLVCLAAVAGLVDWWFPALILLAAVACNRHLARFFYQQKGALFTLGAMTFHQLYYLYSTGAYAWVWSEHQISKLLRS